MLLAIAASTKSIIWGVLTMILVIFVLKHVRAYRVTVHKGIAIVIQKEAWIGGWTKQFGVDQVDSIVVNEVREL